MKLKFWKVAFQKQEFSSLIVLPASRSGIYFKTKSENCMTDVFSASRCHAGWVWWFLVLRHLRMLQEPLAASVARCSFEVCKNVKSAASVSVECLPDQKHDCFGWTSKDVATGSKQINTPPGSSWCSVIPAQRRLKAANYHNKSQPL